MSREGFGELKGTEGLIFIPSVPFSCAHNIAVLDGETGGEDCLQQALDHLRRPMAIDLLKSLFRRTTPGQHRLFDLHVALDGSHAADAARHLDRPSCVSLGSH